jgi:hypothetical protein
METINTDMRTTEASFNAVQMMREIRDRISLETADMTFAELKAYMQKKLDEHESNDLAHTSHLAK